MRRFDPLGLWAIGLEGYAGLGGGIVVYGTGWNPLAKDSRVTGISLRFGFGKGIGLSFDPFGKRPSPDPSQICGDSSLGVYGNLQGGLGPFNAGLQGASGATFSVGTSRPLVTPYDTGIEFTSNFGTAFDTWRFGGTGAVGFEAIVQ